MVSHLTEFASKLRSEKVKPLVQTDRTLREVHDTITSTLKQLANEPSVGLYFVQQHVHNAVPDIVSMKVQMKSTSQEVGYITEDVKDALNSVRSMKEVGPAVIGRMNKNLDSSFSHLASLRPSKRDDLLPDSLTRSGEIEERFLLDPSEQIKSPRGPLLSSEHQDPIEPKAGLNHSVDAQTEVKPLPSRGFQSLPTVFKEDLFGRHTMEGDYSGYVKNAFGTAFQKASSTTVGNLVKWNTYSRDAARVSASTSSDRESQLRLNSGKEAPASLDLNLQNVRNDTTSPSATQVGESQEGNSSRKDKSLLRRDDQGIPSFGSGSSSLSFRGVADYGNPARYWRSIFGSGKPGDGEVSGDLDENKNKMDKPSEGRPWTSSPSTVAGTSYRHPETEESVTEKGVSDDSVITDPDAANGEASEDIQRFLEAEKASNATFAAEKAAELEDWLQDAEGKEAVAE